MICVPNFLSARVDHLDESNTVQLGEEEYNLAYYHQRCSTFMMSVHSLRDFSLKSAARRGSSKLLRYLNTELRADKTDKELSGVEPLVCQTCHLAVKINATRRKSYLSVTKRNVLLYAKTFSLTCTI